jgi:hypothetical protein
MRARQNSLSIDGRETAGFEQMKFKKQSLNSRFSL